jgi:hypothetical protein
MRKAWLSAVITSALIWALVVAALYSSLQPDDLLHHVLTWSPAQLDEMCEVWSQDRQAVLESLHVLNGASYEEAAVVATFVCD